MSACEVVEVSGSSETLMSDASELAIPAFRSRAPPFVQGLPKTRHASRPA
jgi:hypothetical protein